MKKLIYSLSVILLSFSCTEDFEEINTNYNDPEDVKPAYILPTVIFNLADKYGGEAYDFGEILPQYGAYYEYNGTDIYNWGADDMFWEMYDYLGDLNDVKEQAIASDNQKLEAISLILESFMMSVITDAYGYAPYSDALRADEQIYSPHYDSQEEIYAQLFANLERANALADGEGSAEGDILLNEDMTAWKKFANSLRIRLLMRVSNVEDVSNELNTIVNNPAEYPLMESTNDNIAYTYEGTYPNAVSFSSPRGARAYGYELIVPTTTLINTLQDLNDPRLFEWVDPKDGTDDYIGLQPGLPLDQIGEDVAYARRAKSYFNSGDKAKTFFITYSELNSLLAEASQRGLIGGNAEAYYNESVMSSFEQWNVQMPENYIENEATYSTENLYKQRWLSLYHTGVEAWFDWKRTGKPEFIQPGPGARIDEVPRRLIYPTIEQSINSNSYNEAIQAMGGDNITTKVWWDNF